MLWGTLIYKVILQPIELQIFSKQKQSAKFIFVSSPLKNQNTLESINFSFKNTSMSFVFERSKLFWRPY